MEEYSKEQEVTPQEVKKRKKSIKRPISSTSVPEVMDIKELSSYLGIGKSKIYAMVRDNKIPTSRIGRQYRFYKALIDKWLQDRVVGGNYDMPLFQNKKEGEKNG
ncbi:helix-turn-helix domain-containing protein [Elusimicrobiota bacterium]